MKTNGNIKDVFGQADDAFVESVNRTLAQIKQNEEEPIVRRKIRISMVFAVITCLLIAAAALAAATKLGVLDFIVGRYVEDKDILPEATQIIQENVAHNDAHTSSANFSVRQAVFDGKYCYVVVAVTPIERDTLLLGLDSAPEYTTSDFGPRFEGDGRTIAEYARDTGARRLVHTDMGSSPANAIFFDSKDFMLEEDGTLVYMLTGAYEGDQSEVMIDMNCFTWDYSQANGEYHMDEDSREITALTFALKAADIVGEAHSVQAVDFPDCGVRVDSVKLTATPMAVYTEVRFSVTDEAKYAEIDGGLWFRFLDEEGRQMPGGATAGGESMAEDESETRFVQRDSIGAMEVLPISIVLEGYDFWQERRHEAHDIALK